MGGYVISDPSETATRQIYKGEENPITLTRFYNTRYLLAYPSHQVQLALAKKTDNMIRLIAK